MYRLVLFDLDGTLLNERREVAPANVSAIQSLMKQGVRVGLATGRTLKSAEPFWRGLQLNGPLILFNGSRVWDCQAERYVHEVNLPHSEAHYALSLLNELTQVAPVFANLHVNLYFGDEIYISKKTPRSLESEIKDGVAHTVVGDLLPWLVARKIDPVKMMLISEPSELEHFQERFVASGLPSMLVRSERTYLEIMRQGISKGSALAAIDTHFGIASKQVIAFGDNLNDLELIRGCGLGIAMENSHPDVRAAAGKTIGRHDGDAIALCLKEIFHL